MDHMTMATTTGMSMADMTMTSTGSMPTGTGGHSMSGMDGMDMSGGGGGMMMSMSEMAMVFFSSSATPLFSSSWTPTSDGAYAGTCIFLIVLAVLHRALVAARAIFFTTAPASREAARYLDEIKDADDVSSTAPEFAGRRLRAAVRHHPFRVQTETARAVAEVITSGVGYLLMLAVMTMNVGYFLSVLGGIFLGSFLVGRFAATDHH